MTVNSNFSFLIRIVFLCFSFIIFGIHLTIGQDLDVKGEITEVDILNHFRNKGITYSIEGIWLCRMETTIKAYNKGEQFVNKLVQGDSNFKIAFLNVEDKIQMFYYSEESTYFKLQKTDLNQSIKPTPNRSIFLYTLPSVIVDGTRFKECNAEIIVKNDLIQYTTTWEPDNIGDVKTFFIRETTGYKIAPTERDLLITDQVGSIFSFPIKAKSNMQYIDLEIGGESVSYVIDSGASYISITLRMEEALRNMGVLRESDYHGTVDLELADKSIVRVRKVILPMVKIGTLTISNVEAVISDGSLLLGRSFIAKFKSWNLNNYNNILTVETY